MRDPCLECGEPSALRHHIVPQSRGGRATVPLCRACHTLAHGADLGTLRSESAKRSIADGKHAGGLPPYGYTVVGGRMIAESGEQAAINLILAMRLENKSYAEIAAALTERKLKPRGSAWNVSAIRKIVIRYFGPTASE